MVLTYPWRPTKSRPKRRRMRLPVASMVWWPPRFPTVRALGATVPGNRLPLACPIERVPVYEVLREFLRMGARRVLVLSGHAERGHMAALREAADRAMTEVASARIVVLSDYEFVYELRGQLAPPTDGHAGLLETSRVMHVGGSVGPERPVVAYRGSSFVPGPPARGVARERDGRYHRRVRGVGPKDPRARARPPRDDCSRPPARLTFEGGHGRTFRRHSHPRRAST